LWPKKLVRMRKPSQPTNQVLAFWHGQHHLGVLSTFDKDFAKELREWAKKQGYRVEPEEGETHEG
jgi:hypothetical protein